MSKGEFNFRFPPSIIIISTFINQLMPSIDTVLIMCAIVYIISTCEPLYVISIEYRPSLPDDGSYVI